MMNGCQKCDAGFAFLAKSIGNGGNFDIKTDNAAK